MSESDPGDTETAPPSEEDAVRKASASTVRVIDAALRYVMGPAVTLRSSLKGGHVLLTMPMATLLANLPQEKLRQGEEDDAVRAHRALLPGMLYDVPYCQPRHEKPAFELVSADDLPVERPSEHKQLEVLKRERDQLRAQIEIVKSRVAEERRTAARETRRYDQLESRHNELLQRFDQLLGQIRERASANDVLVSTLIADKEGRLRMFETYEGVVRDVGKHSAAVLFERDDDLIEHVYEASQFINQRLPKKGDRIAVYVLAAELPANPEEEEAQAIPPGIQEQKPPDQRKIVRGPLEI